MQRGKSGAKTSEASIGTETLGDGGDLVSKIFEHAPETIRNDATRPKREKTPQASVGTERVGDRSDIQ